MTLWLGVLLLGVLVLARRLLESSRPAVPRLPPPVWHASSTTYRDFLQAEQSIVLRHHLTARQDRYIAQRLSQNLETTHRLRVLMGKTVRRTPAELFRSAQLRQGQVPLSVFTLWPAEPSHTPSTIVFKPEEPQWLVDYVGQPHITEVLTVHLQAMPPAQAVLGHRLLTGLPGFGKTLLAKIIAHELADRAERLGLPPVGFVETYAANLNSVAAMDAIVREVSSHAATVWFIDELHVVDDHLATKLYLLMEEGRYPFAGSLNPTPLPPIMVLGATTDYGRLHPALKRRFGEALMMRPLSRDALQHMAQGLLPSATADAVALLADRCAASGAPHELKTLVAETKVYARAHHESVITPHTVHRVLAAWDLDAHGLRPIDRRVLATLYQRPKVRTKDGVVLGYGASEADVCAASGIDPGEFRAVVRPRLMARGYLEVRPGFGLKLTDKALRDYPEAVACG